MVEIFDKDDADYQDWLKENHDGYVINTRRNMTPLFAAGGQPVKACVSYLKKGLFPCIRSKKEYQKE